MLSYYNINLITNLPENYVLNSLFVSRFEKALNEIKDLDREIDTGTNGKVTVHIYYGNIVGSVYSFRATTISETDTSRLGMSVNVEEFILEKTMEIIEALEGAKIPIGVDETLQITNKKAFDRLFITKLRQDNV